MKSDAISAPYFKREITRVLHQHIMTRRTANDPNLILTFPNYVIIYEHDDNHDSKVPSKQVYLPFKINIFSKLLSVL